MPAIDLAVGKVEDVPKDAADGSSDRVKDFEKFVLRRCHVELARAIGLRVV
ncbi:MULTISPECIES: hypothetical protein [unclassified Bradyrhizobium]|uniref:hypothetical protein n=1 Tax=unclassified Bradyrhizobium TaxID=2631580 RepID=UPI0029163D60|nr:MULTISPECIES: hypothetical protein [unclassified Bradyrhizobium]